MKNNNFKTAEHFNFIIVNNKKVMFKIILIALMLNSCGSTSSNNNKMENVNNSSVVLPKSIHQFKVTGLDGGEIDFSTFKGKKILIVNTASGCGYTPQYKDLQALYDQHNDKLVIVGFPSNDFGGQEPGTNDEIKSFCTKNYSVSFPMAEKVSVKGENAAPIYQWLTKKEKNGVLDAEIKWNFNKFLLNENGEIIAKFESSTNPLSKDITDKL
jgi:glutathione peroxidase